jgi:hypothetical protein
MKSIDVKFSEALDALKKAGRTKQYEETSKNCTTIEAKLNCAESVLKDAGIVPVKEATSSMEEVIKSLSHEQYQLFSKKRAAKHMMSFEEQRKLAEGILAGDIKESAPIRKHNGAADTFVEGNPFGRTEQFSPGYVTETDGGKTMEKRKLMVESVAASMNCSKKEARAFLGLPPKQPKGRKDLSEGQKKEFDFARMIGISEADAFKLVELTGGYK